MMFCKKAFTQSCITEGPLNDVSIHKHWTDKQRANWKKPYVQLRQNEKSRSAYIPLPTKILLSLQKG